MVIINRTIPMGMSKGVGFAYAVYQNAAEITGFDDEYSAEARTNIELPKQIDGMNVRLVRGFDGRSTNQLPIGKIIYPYVTIGPNAFRECPVTEVDLSYSSSYEGRNLGQRSNCYPFNGSPVSIIHTPKETALTPDKTAINRYNCVYNSTADIERIYVYTTYGSVNISNSRISDNIDIRKMVNNACYPSFINCTNIKNVNVGSEWYQCGAFMGSDVETATVNGKMFKHTFSGCESLTEIKFEDVSYQATTTTNPCYFDDIMLYDTSYNLIEVGTGSGVITAFFGRIKNKTFRGTYPNYYEVTS